MVHFTTFIYLTSMQLTTYMISSRIKIATYNLFHTHIIVWITKDEVAYAVKIQKNKQDTLMVAANLSYSEMQNLAKLVFFA